MPKSPREGLLAPGRRGAGQAARIERAFAAALRSHHDHCEPALAGLPAQDAGERERLARRAAERPEVDIDFLASHGVVVGGPSVALALDDLCYLGRACHQQMLAIQTGMPLARLPDAVVDSTAAQFARDLAPLIEQHFQALGEVLERWLDRVLAF